MNQVKLMTYPELVDETVAHYTNNPRSRSRYGPCLYSGPNGERCAAARLCDESVTDLGAMDRHVAPAWKDVFHMATLKPEYEHFDYEQIGALQKLHDADENWIIPDSCRGTRGLSETGKKFVESIKSNFK